MRRQTGLLILGALLSLGQVASAGPLEDGFDAVKRGDHATALKLLRPLAERGDAKAQAAFGWLYKKGNGVRQDYKEAIKWYRLSAAQGDPMGFAELGNAYEEGHGVPQDNVRAHMWLNLAAAFVGGDPWITALLSDIVQSQLGSRDRLAAKMTPSQIERAQEMARKCEQSKFKDCGW